MVDGKYLMSEIVLQPILTIKDESHSDKAMRILSKSEAACLISNSIKSTIIFEPQIVVESLLVDNLNL
jgi:organic hydroperoxide reductase OsmC/OhrA